MKALLRKETGLFVLLVILCVITASINHRFLLHENLQNIARLVGIYGIFSIGAGIVIITSGIDLSVGSMLALLGVLLAMMLNDKHWSPALALLLTVAVGLFVGLFHSVLITRVKMQPFIVTLCGLLSYRGLARFITGDETKGFGDAKGFEGLRDFATSSPLGLPIPCWILIVIAVVMWVVLHRSVYGRHLFAVGNNETASRFSGINTSRIVGSAYILAAFLTSITAILLAFYTNSVSPSGQGNSYELYGIAAAVLGGCSLRGGEGSIIGILLGTILIQILHNVVNLLDIPSSLEYAVIGAVILVGVLVDQLLSRRKRVKA